MAIADPIVATMSSPPGPTSPTKGRGSAAPTEEELILLLLAANPKLALNYKVMAALSGGARTASSLEHRFRKLKVQAKELKDDHDRAHGIEGDEGKDGKAGVAKPVAKPVTKRARTTVKEEEQGSDADEEEGKSLKVAKRAKKGGEDAEDEPVIKAEIKKAAKKLATASKDGSPVKPRVQKKGVARIVKKGDVRSGEDEELVELKGKGKKMKVNVVESKAKEMTGKAAKAGDTVDEGNIGAGQDLGDMQFELEER